MLIQDKKYPALGDLDKMPFGKHKGVNMQDIPAQYLAWLWDAKCNNIQVKNYIWNCQDDINKELDEIIINKYY
jgi:hypothetical protein